MRAFASSSEQRLLSSCDEWASHCGASLGAEPGLGGVGFSACGLWAQLLCGMWNLPIPRFELLFPALTGRFLTTGPLGKSINKKYKQYVDDDTIYIKTSMCVFVCVMDSKSITQAYKKKKFFYFLIFSYTLV